MTPFQIIPALDILDSKLVRLYQGDYAQSTIYADDPLPQAQEFVKAGCQLLHLVDLNAARSAARDVNRNSIQKIVTTVKNMNSAVQIELGGGIRNRDALHECFELGIDRCIIGTAAIHDPDFLSSAVTQYGAERIIVGVDVRDDRVQISGWEKASLWRANDLLEFLAQKQGVREVILTDISRDGTLAGPGNAILENYIEKHDLRFILSGGISALRDLENLLRQRHPRLIGAISGRALYEKKLDLRQALALCEKVHRSK